MDMIRQYMTLSVGVVVLLIVVTHAGDFNTVLSGAGDVWAKQLTTLQGK